MVKVAVPHTKVAVPREVVPSKKVPAAGIVMRGVLAGVVNP